MRLLRICRGRARRLAAHAKRMRVLPIANAIHGRALPELALAERLRWGA